VALGNLHVKGLPCLQSVQSGPLFSEELNE
jgi:hypothetical protein